MRLNELYRRLRRRRVLAKEPEQTGHETRRRTETLESMTRAAQIKSIKPGMHR